MAYAVYSEVRQDLIDRAGIDEEWLEGSLLDSILSEAATSHNAAYSFSTLISRLPPREVPVVRLLAWAEVQRCRASRFATQQDIKGASPGGIGTDKNTPFYKCMALAEKLAEDYKTLCRQLGVTPSNTSFGQGFQTTLDTVVSAKRRGPFTVIPGAFISGQATLDGDNAWTIEWDFDAYLDFQCFVVFYDSGADPIRQQWNQSSDTGYAQIRDGLEPIAILENQEQVALKITGLSTGVVHRVLIVTKSRTGQLGYSNEFTISS